MNAVFTAISSELRRRRLQTLVIGVVILLTSGAATLALSLAVETDAPYDHAFARVHGAHLTLVYDGSRVKFSQLQATAHAPGVTSAAGPWPEAESFYSLQTGDQGRAGGLTIVGRNGPDAPVDRLTMESGHWARSPGEVVVSQQLADDWNIGVGDTLTPDSGNRGPSLRVVGIAASISRYTDAWVLPNQVSALAGGKGRLEYQMAYRVRPADTDAQLRTATQAITGHLPRGSVVTVGSYLQVKHDADITAAVMVPFLLAFSAFALAASVLIVANVITGVVIASYRDIGIMKSVGFTPRQVTAALLGQVLGPALVGCAAGVALGTLASQPFLSDTAHALGLPTAFTAAVPVDLGVFALIGLVVAAAAWIPAHRAGRMSAVAAITRGSAPAMGGSSRLAQATSRLPLPRALSLGLGDSFSRPARSLMTAGAVLTGVATVVFALSLHLSLGQVAEHLLRDKYVQVDLYPALPAGPGSQVKGGLAFTPPPAPSDRQVARLLRQDPATVRYVAESQDNVTVPGIAEPVPYFAYRGPSGWIGYALISGRWFSGPGEVVAPTRLLRQAHLHVGQTITAYYHTRPLRLRIVGEILDQSYNDLLLRGTWTSLAAVDPHLRTLQYEVQIQPGTSPEAYAQRIRQPALDAEPAQRADEETSFILINGVVAGLALMLIVIAVAGVFNTVVLNTREKARDVAILKAVGMAPAQVVGMVVASVALLGLLAGAVGVPGGLLLHREILQIMGQVATGTDIPPQFFDLIGGVQLPLLGLAGVAVAALGAWLPAQWAAASGVAEVLQAE